MKKESLFGPLLLIITWYIAYYLNVVNRLFLPAPHEVLFSVGRSITSQIFWIDLGETLWRTFIGFCIASIIGIPIGSDPAPFMINLFLYH